MAKKSREPKEEKMDGKSWMKRINRAKKFRDQVKDKQNWARILDEYKGEYKINNQSIKAPPINIVYGYVQTAISRLYFRNPHMTVNPRGAQYIEKAKLMEVVINFLFDELGIKNENTKVLMDALLIGHGWIKYGYINEIGETETDVPNENSEYIKTEEIFAAHVPWEDIVFDVTLCKDPPHDCSWIAHRIIRPVDDAKEDKRFSNSAKIKANVTIRDAKGEKIDESLRDSDLELFEYWEVHDKKSNKIIYVCDTMDDVLSEKENTYEMKGFPFSMLAFNRVSGEAYPLSDVAIIEPQILERIKLRSGQINHIKRWARQLSIEEGAMTKEEMEKFAQGIDGAITQRKKGFAPPEPIQYADLQRESFLLDDLIQRDFDAVIGQNEIDRGGQAKTKTKTKYELVQQEEGTSVRQNKRQDVLEDFLEEVALKIISLIKQFQTQQKYVRMSGMKPEEIAASFPGVHSDATGLYFTKDDIQGDYDVEAKAGSTLPLNRDNKIRIMESLLKVGPAIGIVPGSPVSMELGRELLRELDLKGVEKAYEEQIQQMKLAAQQPPAPQPQPGPQRIIHHHVQGEPGQPQMPPGMPPKINPVMNGIGA